jgi:uracil-DNA glycosylase
MEAMSELLEQVFACRRCDEAWGFSSRTPSAGYFKFPPLIGKGRDAQLLFVGINPRISDSNRWLHEHLMRTKANFLSLSANIVRSRSYIGFKGQESHYRFHVQFVNEAVGGDLPFEQVAAVTEIFFCATRDSRNLPNPGSPCADLYFGEIVRQTNPVVIVSVGARVMSYFTTRQHEYRTGDQLFLKFDDRSVPVVRMPHPADPNLSESEKRQQFFCVAAKTRKMLRETSASI